MRPLGKSVLIHPAESKTAMALNRYGWTLVKKLAEVRPGMTIKELSEMKFEELEQYLYDRENSIEEPQTEQSTAVPIEQPPTKIL